MDRSNAELKNFLDPTAGAAIGVAILMFFESGVQYRIPNGDYIVQWVIVNVACFGIAGIFTGICSLFKSQAGHAKRNFLLLSYMSAGLILFGQYGNHSSPPRVGAQNGESPNPYDQFDPATAIPIVQKDSFGGTLVDQPLKPAKGQSEIDDFLDGKVSAQPASIDRSKAKITLFGLGESSEGYYQLDTTTVAGAGTKAATAWVIRSEAPGTQAMKLGADFMMIMFFIDCPGRTIQPLAWKAKNMKDQIVGEGIHGKEQQRTVRPDSMDERIFTTVCTWKKR